MISRRAFLAGTTALALSSPAWATTSRSEFTANTVRDRARDLARRSYMARPEVPQDWRELTYDQYRDIRYQREQSLWFDTDASYNIDFFAPGLYFPRAVKVWEVEDAQATPVAFHLDQFNKGPLVPDLIRQDDSLGYSGLRLWTDQGHPNGKTEFAVFHGASYFRAIGIGLVLWPVRRGVWP